MLFKATATMGLIVFNRCQLKVAGARAITETLCQEKRSSLHNFKLPEISRSSPNDPILP